MPVPDLSPALGRVSLAIELAMRTAAARQTAAERAAVSAALMETARALRAESIRLRAARDQLRAGQRDRLSESDSVRRNRTAKTA